MFISPQVWFETTVLVTIVTSNISPVACANNGKQKTFCVSWFTGDSRSINKKLRGKFLSSNITRNHNTSIWYSTNWHIGIPFHTRVIDLFAWKFARSLVLACSVAPFSDRHVPGSCHHMLLLCFKSNHLFIPLQIATDILLVEEALHQMIYISWYILKTLLYTLLQLLYSPKELLFSRYFSKSSASGFFPSTFCQPGGNHSPAADECSWSKVTAKNELSFFLAEIMGQKFMETQQCGMCNFTVENLEKSKFLSTRKALKSKWLGKTTYHGSKSTKCMLSHQAHTPISQWAPRKKHLEHGRVVTFRIVGMETAFTGGTLKETSKTKRKKRR